MATLERAIQITVLAHQGQKDRFGAPYILHPLRVMIAMESDPEKIVAILHDVVEDSDCTLEDVKQEGFSGEVLDALDALTRREGETYEDYIERAAANEIACPVRCVDVKDNMDLTRVSKFTESERERYKRYHKVWLRLQNRFAIL